MHNITDTLSDSFANFKMLHPGSFHYALEGAGTVLVATGYRPPSWIARIPAMIRFGGSDFIM
jgi:hypothetical protein